MSDESMSRLFGLARLASFYDSGENRERTLDAYAWQLRLGQALPEPIGIRKVFLRNTVDDAIGSTADDIVGRWGHIPSLTGEPSPQIYWVALVPVHE